MHLRFFNQFSHYFSAESVCCLVDCRFLISCFSADIVAIHFGDEVVGIPTTAGVSELFTGFSLGVIVIARHRRRTQSFILWAIAQQGASFFWQTVVHTRLQISEVVAISITATIDEFLTPHRAQVEGVSS